MLYISKRVTVPFSEIKIRAMRSQGPGGQNVNKVSTAVHMRFNIITSSLPDAYKERLLKLNDQRITKEGEIIIKAQQHKSQEKNKEEALRRLQELIQSVEVLPKKRKPTKPTPGSSKKRLDGKSKRGQLKALRGKVNEQA